MLPLIGIISEMINHRGEIARKKARDQFEITQETIRKYRYSLGNALFDPYGLEATRRSALVLVTLDSSGARELEIIPFLIDLQDSRIVEADLEDAQVIMSYFK